MKASRGVFYSLEAFLISHFIYHQKGGLIMIKRKREMKSVILKVSCLILVICALLLQACATIKITRKDLESVENITVVRYKTPDLKVKTLTGVIFTFAGGGAIVPTVIASQVDKKSTENATQGVIFPDYGELLMYHFIKIAQEEIRDWPKMTSISNPVKRGYQYKDGALIVFDIDHLWITLVGGLTIEGDVIMKNTTGHKIFRRHFFYRSRDFGIKKGQKEYIADNAKLLIEEIPIAAEHTARDLIIKYLKESL